MKTAVVYYSRHHENTKKLLDAMAENNDITLIDVTKMSNADLNEYDLIGFASGIYYSKYHKTVLNFAKNNLPQNKKVFFVHTYGVYKEGHTKAIREEVSKKSALITGEYGSLGFNTFGPFKLIGGIAKNHPDKDEIKGAVSFYENLVKKYGN